MKPFYVGLLLSLMLGSRVSDGAISVITIPGSQTMDPINLIQTTATAIQTLDMLNRIIRDMQPWAALAIDGLPEELMALAAGAQVVSALIPHDPEAVQGIFDTLYPPTPEQLCDPEVLTEWRSTTRQQTRLALLDSMRGQASLFRQLDMLVRRAIGVILQIAATAGNVEGVQTVGQNHSILIQEQAQIGVVMGSFNRAIASQESYKITEDDAERCIHSAILDAPTRSVPFRIGGGRQ